MPTDEQINALGPVPETLAGFQLLCDRRVELGDLLVFTPTDRAWANGYIGSSTNANGYLDDGFCSAPRVYRRSAPPRPEGWTAPGDMGPHHSTLRPEDAPAQESKARTNDAGKPPLALLPWAAMRELAHVQAFGAAKYGDFHNYRKGMEVSRACSCVVRHVAEFMEGHDKDAESGRNPLAHALARLAFLIQNLADGTAIDDRFKPAAGGRA